MLGNAWCMHPFSREREKVPEGRMRGLWFVCFKGALTPTPLPHAGEGLGFLGSSWCMHPFSREREKG